VILYAAHIVSCSWYFVGSNCGPEGWVPRSETQDVANENTTNSYRYATSLYTVGGLGMRS
jgi:hypothetical protein